MDLDLYMFWASCNGGKVFDNCNCDGYTNLPYTVSISSTSERENVPWYSEPCASTIASTYSSGEAEDAQILTTDLRNTCTDHHTGTSASAPIAAGIIALTLEANPNLGWRDVQHIIIRTSKRQLLAAQDWSKNAVGRWFSHRYGYGLMDAGAMVDLALQWRNVPRQRMCSQLVVRSTRLRNQNYIEPQNTANNPFVKEFHYEKSECLHKKIDRLEHVIAKISLSYSRRGALEIFLVSPSGTRSMILGKRIHDSSPKGFQNFHFLSVHFWDENPAGKWKLQIINTGSPNSGNRGNLKKFEIFFYGTSIDQDHGRSRTTYAKKEQRSSNSTINPASSTAGKKEGQILTAETADTAETTSELQFGPKKSEKLGSSGEISRISPHLLLLPFLRFFMFN